MQCDVSKTSRQERESDDFSLPVGEEDESDEVPGMTVSFFASESRSSINQEGGDQSLRERNIAVRRKREGRTK